MSKQIAIVLDIAGEAQKQGITGAEFHDSTDGGFGIFLGNIISVAMTLAAILVLAFLIWGGIEWITSAGDKSKAESARNRITSAIVGIVILSATTAIFLVVEQFLGIDLLTFT